MRAILRHPSALGGQLILGLFLFAFLTPPFGLRAYLDARPQSAAETAQLAFSVTRPLGSMGKLPTSAFATATPSPLDGIRGKGAWFMIFNGDWTDPDADRAQALVDSAVSADLSHIYVRVADSRRHFYGAPALQDLLPIAHRHQLRVIGWIEPMLNDPTRDAADAIAAARFQEEGQRLDGLALSMEAIRWEPYVTQYLSGIRSGAAGLPGVGALYLLIASTLPTPADHRGDAYATMSRYCQVFAPMAYWRATGLPQFTGPNGVRSYLDQIFAQFRDPAVNPFNRPLTITAQAYDAALESGTPGPPPVDEIVASMDETRALGGLSWSFYRLRNADNGVTAGEVHAITGYPFWQRFTSPAIAAKALIASADQPVAY